MIEFPENGPNSKPGLGVRHVQALVMHLCMVVMLVVRSSMGVAIIAMTDKPRNGTDFPTYNWDKKQQGAVLSSFYWGYIICQIPAGVLAKRYGAKLILGIGISMDCLFCLTTPTAALYGWQAVCVLRMASGLIQGCLYPAIHTLIGTWIPVEERSRFTTLIICGAQVGIVISMPLCGYLSSTSYGWPLIFKVLAAISALISVLWFIIASDTPAQSRFIKEKEKKFIENSLQSNNTVQMEIPWRHILTSTPVYAIIIAHIGLNWVLVLFFVQMPSFMKHVLGADGSLAGLLSSLPFITMALMGIVFSCFCDYLYNRRIFSLTKLRKIFQTIAAVGTSVTLILICFIPREYMIMSVIALTCSLGCFSAIKCGSSITNIDVAPNFAGVIFAIANCASNTVAIAMPITAGIITAPDPNDPKRWAVVFFIAAAIMLTSGLIFIKFGTSEKQAWNDILPTGPESRDSTELRLLKKDTSKVLQDITA